MSSGFATRLIRWHKQCGRHDLPWQQTPDPYRVWLSEIMLQQTQVATVIPYYQRFLARFPSLTDLAAASQAEVMALWSGLGYYARARNLHRCAQIVMAHHGGRFPQAAEEIAELPGIGRSTANAIAVFCFGAHQPILDGNVKRVLCRTHGISGFPDAAATQKVLWPLAESLLPKREVATYIQAQMDLGATVCTRSNPACLTGHSTCPLSDVCVANKTGRVTVLPEAKRRKAVPQREAHVLLLHQDDRILMEHRPPSGIWGGLLSLPELAPDGHPSDHAITALGCQATNWQALPSLRHSFTHFQLTLLPLAAAATRVPGVSDASGHSWLTRDEIDAAGLPTPIRKIIQGFFDR